MAETFHLLFLAVSSSLPAAAGRMREPSSAARGQDVGRPPSEPGREIEARLVKGVLARAAEVGHALVTEYAVTVPRAGRRARL